MSDDKDDKNKNKYIIPLKNRTAPPAPPTQDQSCTCEDGSCMDILDKISIRLASNGGYVADLHFAMGSPDDIFIFPSKEELMTFLSDLL